MSASPDVPAQLADLKRALDHAAIVATTDVSGRITYVNDKICEIARRTAELHGGTLTLSCPPDGGTLITLIVPLRASASSPPPAD